MNNPASVGRGIGCMIGYDKVDGLIIQCRTKKFVVGWGPIR